MSGDFPAFALSEEHEALRESVRALADDKIAPRAAEIDRTSEFPWDVHEALDYALGYIRERKQFSRRSRTSRACSSWWPTWPCTR
jgi:alkylation response protein AidB-like acyl-CoA dehydrogenase